MLQFWSVRLSSYIWTNSLHVDLKHAGHSEAAANVSVVKGTQSREKAELHGSSNRPVYCVNLLSGGTSVIGTRVS